jgi:hypothetical protein
MNTITLDNKTYDAVVAYAKTNNVTVAEVVKAGINLLKAQFGKKDTSSRQYYISPEVKALETGFKCPEDLSDDYKQEMKEGLSGRYL